MKYFVLKLGISGEGGIKMSKSVLATALLQLSVAARTHNQDKRVADCHSRRTTVCQGLSLFAECHNLLT